MDWLTEEEIYNLAIIQFPDEVEGSYILNVHLECPNDYPLATH
jgi:hypothetical protein